MRSGVPFLFGVFLVLATSLLLGSVVGERHSRRITEADLPPSSNSSGQNDIGIKKLDFSNCTSDTNGSCRTSLQEETKRKAKDKLPELSSDDASHVIESVADEVLQERLHAHILRHLATTPSYSSYEGPYYQDGEPIDSKPSTSKKSSDISYGNHDVGTETDQYNATLTTPRIGLFDDRFARVSESIRQNLEELDEQHAFRASSSTDDPSEESTEPRSIPPTSSDLTPRNGSKVALEYTNHVSIKYNDTSDPPRSVHRDIVVENGTHVDFSSSYIHTEEFPEATVTPETPVEGRRAESNAHSNGHTPAIATSSHQSEGAASVANAIRATSEKTSTRNISSQLITYPQQTTSKNIIENRVTPGEKHSTTLKPTIGKSPFRSQQFDITTEDDSTNISSEHSTVTPKSNKVRYSTKRIQISGVPTTVPSPTKSYGSSSPRTRIRPYTRRPSNNTTSETESSTLPVSTSPFRSRGRMYESRRNQANATNSLDSSPTSVPIASISDVTRRKQQTTRNYWNRPVGNNTSREELDKDDITMVRMNVSTVSPSSTPTLSIMRNLVQGSRSDETGTTERDRPTDGLTTQPAYRNTVPRKFSNFKRRPSSAEELDRTTLAPADIETTISTNDNFIRARPIGLKMPATGVFPSVQNSSEELTHTTSAPAVVGETTISSYDNLIRARPAVLKRPMINISPLVLNSSEDLSLTTSAPAGRETTLSSYDNAIRARPTTLKRPFASVPPNTEGNDIVVRKPMRSRGTVRFSNATKGLNIPPTAAAWALASLRGPVEANRLIQEPAENSTNAEINVTANPTEEATVANSSTNTERATTLAAMQELVMVEITTTSPKTLRESESGIQFLTTSAPPMASTTPSTSPKSSSASMQENRISTVQVHPPKEIQESILTSTSNEDLTSTTVLAETTTEDGTMATTISTTTIDTDFVQDDEIHTTIVPFVTDSPINVTEAVTDDSTTEVSTLPSYSKETTRSRTTTTSNAVTEAELSTTPQPVGMPEELSTMSVIVDNEEEDPDVLISTELPRTSTTEVFVVPVEDIDLGEEIPGQQGEGEEHNPNHHVTEEPDYPAETESSVTIEPKVVVINAPWETTTQASDDDQTTPEAGEVNATSSEEAITSVAPTVNPALNMSSESWLPSSEEVTAYLRVTIQTSWRQLCEHREEFRVALAGMLATTTKRNITAEDVVLVNVGASQCADVVTSGDDVMKLITVNMYVLNEAGTFDKELNEMFPILWSQSNYPNPLEIKQVDLMYGELPSISDSGNAGVIAAISISCVGAVCLLLLAALLIVMRKRQKRFNYGQRCTPVSLDAYSLDSVSVYNSVRRKGGFRASKRSYGNPAFDDPGAPSHPMNFAGLANFSSDRLALEEEFAMVPQIIPKADELPEGAETKNRYSNVVPLPETRVPLALVEGETLSDYINANYVRGPKNESKFYIACQAPMPSTVTDFWRMIWEQQSKVILMLTDLVENGVEKCSDYLPPSEVLDCHRLFGDYQITLKKREEREKYVISTLQIKNLETNTWREVTHLWYLSWPHQGVPEEATSIIAFLIEARTFMRSNQGPNVIHCSPGTGRTGTVLACDICIREFEQTRMVDIPRCVYRLRRDRGGAVKTRDQYVFIYEVLNTYAIKLTGGGMDSI